MDSGWVENTTPVCALVYQAVSWVWVSTGTHLPRLMLVRFSCPWIHPCLSACMCCEASLAELRATRGRRLIMCIQSSDEERGKENNTHLDVLSVQGLIKLGSIISGRTMNIGHEKCDDLHGGNRSKEEKSTIVLYIFSSKKHLFVNGVINSITNTSI